MALFLQMNPSEQHHSIVIIEKLKQQGDTHPELLEAALLHDIGKIRVRLQSWERVLIVVGQFLFPKRSKDWGNPPDYHPGQALVGWRKSFIVAVHHPEWGAEMAALAGASPLAVALILRHQEPPKEAHLTQALSSSAKILEEQLLQRLQWLDNHY